MECHHLTGEDDFVLKVAATSLPHLEHVIYRLAELAQPTTAIVLSSPVSRRTIGAPVREDH
jgi:Lrp/AsnC family leucine-responsive transcriptional regulator